MIGPCRTGFRGREIICIWSNNQAPPAMKTQPAIRERNLPNGNAFSNKTNPDSAAIHNTFGRRRINAGRRWLGERLGCGARANP
jgi:hypothetical protein